MFERVKSLFWNRVKFVTVLLNVNCCAYRTVDETDSFLDEHAKHARLQL